MEEFMHIVMLLLVCLLRTTTAWAEPSDDGLAALREQVETLTRTVRELNDTVQRQQARIQALEAEPAQPDHTASKSQDQVVLPVARRAALSGTQSLAALNPEIGVNADLVGQLSESSLDTEGNDKLSARELELTFGHPIDPYSRLDVTIGFSDFEDVDLEEAYVTHWGLPAEMNARLGRFRPKVGKASSVHRDVLETVDEPLVVARYLGEEGLFRTGAEASGFIPTPWTVLTHEVTGGVMEGGIGEGGTLFGDTRRRPSFYGHLKNFWDISDETNAEIGLTYLTGSSDADASYEVHALGLDATLSHFVRAGNPLKWQSELYVQDRDEASDAPNNPWGWYSLLDYRLNPRVALGARLDYVEPVGLVSAQRVRAADTAFGGYLTFYQSEWARWRLQYRHTDFAAGGDDNTVFLQGTVSIGVHKHALQ
jgi:hypothetical protein